MAISPLDLQTLFTQMDKVGGKEAAQREGAAILQSIQQQKIQQQMDEKIRSVNESQDTGDGAEGIKDKKGRAGQEDRKHNHSAEEPEENAGEGGVIKDPALGKNIDVSL
jgi:hypothetical protein